MHHATAEWKLNKKRLIQTMCCVFIISCHHVALNFPVDCQHTFNLKCLMMLSGERRHSSIFENHPVAAQFTWAKMNFWLLFTFPSRKTTQRLSFIIIWVLPPAATGITKSVNIRVHVTCRQPYPDLRAYKVRPTSICAATESVWPRYQKQSNVGR